MWVYSRVNLFACTLFLSAIWLSVARADAKIAVLASIKPVHSLVAAVMKGVGTPTLLVDGTASPHTFRLKPSDARKLQNSNVVFWIGHDFETFLVKPLNSIGANVVSVELAATKGLTRHIVRSNVAFKHDHAGHSNAHGDHGGPPERIDMHLWLDPSNAILMTVEIVKRLSIANPENQAIYQANGDALKKNLAELQGNVMKALASLSQKRFIVFHDSFQYFEKRFGLQAAGAIVVSPDIPLGAKQVQKISTSIKNNAVTCVFSEPQFSSKIVESLTKNSNIQSQVLDPLGSQLESGPTLYSNLLTQIAKQMQTCLQG